MSDLAQSKAERAEAQTRDQRFKVSARISGPVVAVFGATADPAPLSRCFVTGGWRQMLGAAHVWHTHGITLREGMFR